MTNPFVKGEPLHADGPPGGRPEVRDAIARERAARADAAGAAAFVPGDRLRDAIDAAIETPALRRELRRAAADAHRRLLGTDAGATTVEVDLGRVLRAHDPHLAAALPGGLSTRLLTVDGDALPLATRTLGDAISTAAAVLPPLAVVALLAALAIAPAPRRALRAAAVGAAAAAAFVLVSIALGRAAVVEATDAVAGVSLVGARDAVGALWDAYAAGARDAALVTLVVAIAVALATFVPRRRRAAP